MLNVITALIALAVASAAVWLVVRLRKRDVGFGASVSQQWLMQHQGDDRS
jgi:hypothetical protein